MKLTLLLASIALVGCTNNNLRLDYVQAIWRHGARSALAPLYPIYEEDWVLGGGGYGELTPMGSGEMYELGAKMRQRYINNLNLLSKKYVANEIFIRSTDKNRTILSANALLYGLYPPGVWNLPNIDYPPNVGKWQNRFTFVPVHIIDDCVTRMDCDCPRYAQLQSLLQTLPEFLAAFGPYYAMTMQVQTLYNTTFATPADMLQWPDTLKCQKEVFAAELAVKTPWFNTTWYNQGQILSAPIKGMIEGHFLQNSTKNGINIAQEIKTLHAGPFLNEMRDRAVAKFNCIQNSTTCKGFFKTNKFYGYSAHDSTLYAILVALGLQNITDSLDYWPNYAAGIFFEFYTKNNQQFFKILYRKGDDQPISPVSAQLAGCNANHLCPISVLNAFADLYKPLPDINSRCQVPL